MRDFYTIKNSQCCYLMFNFQLFKVDLVVDSNLVSDLEIFQQLREIRRVSLNENPKQELGYLTTLPRFEWANVRQSLMKSSYFNLSISFQSSNILINYLIILDPVNRKSLKMIEKSSFMICLDEKFDETSCITPDDECVKSGLQILHGSGVEFNSRNRWYDKTLQVITFNT